MTPMELIEKFKDELAELEKEEKKYKNAYPKYAAAYDAYVDKYHRKPPFDAYTNDNFDAYFTERHDEQADPTHTTEHDEALKKQKLRPYTTEHHDKRKWVLNDRIKRLKSAEKELNSIENGINNDLLLRNTNQTLAQNIRSAIGEFETKEKENDKIKLDGNNELYSIEAKLIKAGGKDEDLEKRKNEIKAKIAEADNVLQSLAIQREKLQDLRRVLEKVTLPEFTIRQIEASYERETHFNKDLWKQGARNKTAHTRDLEFVINSFLDPKKSVACTYNAMGELEVKISQENEKPQRYNLSQILSHEVDFSHVRLSNELFKNYEEFLLSHKDSASNLGKKDGSVFVPYAQKHGYKFTDEALFNEKIDPTGDFSHLTTAHKMAVFLYTMEDFCCYMQNFMRTDARQDGFGTFVPTINGVKDDSAFRNADLTSKVTQVLLSVALTNDAILKSAKVEGYDVDFMREFNEKDKPDLYKIYIEIVNDGMRASKAETATESTGEHSEKSTETHSESITETSSESKESNSIKMGEVGANKAEEKERKDYIKYSILNPDTNTFTEGEISARRLRAGVKKLISEQKILLDHNEKLISDLNKQITEGPALNDELARLKEDIRLAELNRSSAQNKLNDLRELRNSTKHNQINGLSSREALRNLLPVILPITDKRHHTKPKSELMQVLSRGEAGKLMAGLNQERIDTANKRDHEVVDGKQMESGKTTWHKAATSTSTDMTVPDKFIEKCKGEEDANATRLTIAEPIGSPSSTPLYNLSAFSKAEGEITFSAGNEFSFQETKNSNDENVKNFYVFPMRTIQQNSKKTGYSHESSELRMKLIDLYGYYQINAQSNQSHAENSIILREMIHALDSDGRDNVVNMVNAKLKELYPENKFPKGLPSVSEIKIWDKRHEVIRRMSRVALDAFSIKTPVEVNKETKRDSKNRGPRV